MSLDKYKPITTPAGYECQICSESFRRHNEILSHLRWHRKNELAESRRGLYEALR